MKFVYLIFLKFLIIIFAFYFFLPLQPQKTNLSEFNLANGLSVIHIENRKIPAIMFMLWVKVGAIDEKKDKSGIAHYLEHVLFHGSKNYPQGEYSDFLHKNGGYQNAFTSYDNTVYFSFFPKELLPEILDFEIDRFSQPEFITEKIENEKQIVLEERLWRKDNNQWHDFYQLMKKNLYGADYPYSKPIIGYKEDIKNIEKEDLESFFAEYYNPENSFLIIAGDISKAELKLKLADNFAKWERKIAPVKPDLTNYKLSHTSFKQYESKTSFYAYNRTYILPDTIGNNFSKINEFSLVANLLAGDENSLLAQEFIDKENLVQEVYADFSGSRRGPKSFSLGFIANDQENLEKAVASLDEFLKGKLGNISERKVNITKESLYKSGLYQLESFKSLGFNIGQLYALGFSLAELEKQGQKLLQLNVTDVNQALYELVNSEDYVEGYLLPKNLE